MQRSVLDAEDTAVNKRGKILALVQCIYQRWGTTKIMKEAGKKDHLRQGNMIKRDLSRWEQGCSPWKQAVLWTLPEDTIHTANE